MILSRYLLRHIHQGTLIALLVLVSLSLFFLLVRELEHLGRGSYGILQVVEFIVLTIPTKVVEFMPLAALLGTMLSLGSLAGNSEIIAMQAAGVSMRRLLLAVTQAALVLALLSFLLAEWIVPRSETGARDIRTSAINSTRVLHGKQELWIKDQNRVLHIKELLPNGIARGVEIYRLDANNQLQIAIAAAEGIPVNGKWHLKRVNRTLIGESSIESDYLDEFVYGGSVSNQLLDSLIVEPRQMSSSDLYQYVDFLQQNNLDGSVQSLAFWQKVFAPFEVVIMCLLAVPFVLGSQRQSNTGQRLILGILLGLGYVVSDKLLTQLGVQFGFKPLLNAFLPIAIFSVITFYLLFRNSGPSR